MVQRRIRRAWVVSALADAGIHLAASKDQPFTIVLSWVNEHHQFLPPRPPPEDTEGFFLNIHMDYRGEPERNLLGLPTARSLAAAKDARHEVRDNVAHTLRGAGFQVQPPHVINPDQLDLVVCSDARWTDRHIRILKLLAVASAPVPRDILASQAGAAADLKGPPPARFDLEIAALVEAGLIEQSRDGPGGEAVAMTPRGRATTSLWAE